MSSSVEESLPRFFFFPHTPIHRCPGFHTHRTCHCQHTRLNLRSLVPTHMPKGSTHTPEVFTDTLGVSTLILTPSFYTDHLAFSQVIRPHQQFRCTHPRFLRTDPNLSCTHPKIGSFFARTRSSTHTPIFLRTHSRYSSTYH